MIGTRFGRLQVSASAGSKNWHRMWVCQCDCGNTVVRSTAILKSGKTKSCGCLRRELSTGGNNNAFKHGHTTGKFSPTYHSWASMIVRCTNKNRKTWRHYGGRGIKVCERWLTFENFLDDMGERPAGMSLDRIDVDGDYCPENCRWADNVTQARNSRQTVWVLWDGCKRRLVDLCEELQISINTVRDRVRHKGFSYESAIEKAVLTRTNK